MRTIKILFLLLASLGIGTSCSESKKNPKEGTTETRSSDSSIGLSFGEIEQGNAPIKEITVYTAKEIRTMEREAPIAHAVAVANGKIVAVGEMDDLKPWLEKYDHKIDDTFKDKILLPGLIDPHVHPSLPAVLMQFPFLAPDDWNLPTGYFPGAKTPEEYETQLKVYVNEYFANTNRDTTIPFITWGYHSLWHGEMSRQKLNEWFGDKPVMLWQRSFHEVYGNDAAFDLLGVDDAVVSELQKKGLSEEMDWEHGHFWENGLVGLIPNMDFLFREDRYGTGMENFFKMLTQNGVTSVMDMGVGIFGDPVGETALIRKIAEGNQVPARIVLTPIITDFKARGKSPEEALAEVKEWEKGNSKRVMFDNHFKIMMDGAIFSGLSQYNDPGYIDGHKAQWMAPLDYTYSFAELFWNEGYQIHAHTNGDKSADALIEILKRLQAQKPRIDHRMSLEHFAYATETQAQQMEALGMIVSANPYYQYILADIYAKEWLGPDRAKNMNPLGALVNNNIKFSLHSDCPMAPLSPLTLVWAAVNRKTINENENNPAQKITVQRAIEAVTIDAAWSMRWEGTVGSIKAGKRADFSVLEENPFTVDPMKIKEIEVWGVVFEGKKYQKKN